MVDARRSPTVRRRRLGRELRKLRETQPTSFYEEGPAGSKSAGPFSGI